MSDAPTVSVPANVTLSLLSFMGWMHTLDVLIALESDAGRRGTVRVLTDLYNSIGRTLPKELAFEERRTDA